MGFLILGFVLGLIAAGILYAAGSPWRKEEAEGRRAAQETLSNQAAKLLKERNELAYDLEKEKYEREKLQRVFEEYQQNSTPKRSLSEIIQDVEQEMEALYTIEEQVL